MTNPAAGSRDGFRLYGMTAEQELQWLERSVFEPLRTALRAGTIGRMELLTDDTLFAAGPASRLRFWRRAQPLAGQLP